MPSTGCRAACCSTCSSVECSKRTTFATADGRSGGIGETMADYIERMKVREILTECSDIDAEATSYLLHDIDMLPAVVVPAQEVTAWLVKSSAGREVFLYKPNAEHTAEVQRGEVIELV